MPRCCVRFKRAFALVVLLACIAVAPRPAEAACPGDAVVCFNGQGAPGDDGDDVVGENADPGSPGSPRTDTYNGPTILPAGSNKDGVRSITSGGKGGVGGDAILIINAGNGGKGGDGRALDLTNTAIISTNGTKSNGIAAIANGGDGGDAGGAGFIGGGGDGGAGGNAGSVLLNNSNQITTVGDDSHGILAEANGGHAGHGGGALVGESGSGGAAASGGSVNVTNSGVISTSGKRADGILAQSVGGGGGTGGSGGIGPLARWGGKSTGGHDGGVVTVTSTNTITTDGVDSNGILAQSIGGAGGNASGAVGIVGLGGDAGGGGDGKEVTVNAGGTITTKQDGSHGILSQSIGGGGGNGGFSIGVVAIGGNGGPGGQGGDVNVNQVDGQALDIVTKGQRSIGILAQSIGGGGGDGGMAFGAGTNVALGMGGSGEQGGFAHTVTVNVGGPGSINTDQKDSIGILAQSIGGGGGNGGLAAAISLGSVAVGGQGGPGNTGGDVHLTNGLTVTTGGELAHGLYAQSVGGGGGNGGAALSVAAGGTLSVSVGGKGGAGGDAGNVVTLDNTGDITTHGASAYAINAQSIGGGGGDGGFAFSAAVLNSPISLSIGGDGNAAGDGKAVNVTSTGANLTTTNENSHAVYAVSIGGGGGSGGIGGAGALTFALGIGGKGNSGGAGGNVDVKLFDGDGEANFIDTDKFMSNGIVARSVGGGGGDGALGVGASFVAGLAIGGNGAPGGDAGTVTVENHLDIVTNGALSNGIFAQSIGGGGGDGATAVSINPIGIITADVTIGGTGGHGGAAKEVKVTNDATIAVHGAGSKAIIAQAIGGGGGKGGAGYALGVNIGIPGLIPGATAKFVIGGTGGEGGDAADVTVESKGSLTSDGNGIVFTPEGAIHGGGILAQSIGGGGGTGGTASAKSLGLFSSLDLSLVIGGNANVGGDGKAVTVNTTNVDDANRDKITTVGFNAVGIFAQSVGGGGGAGGRADSWQKDIGADPGLPTLTAGVTIGGNACKKDPEFGQPGHPRNAWPPPAAR